MKRADKIQLLADIASGKKSIKDIPWGPDLDKFSIPQLYELLRLSKEIHKIKSMEELSVADQES